MSIPTLRRHLLALAALALAVGPASAVTIIQSWTTGFTGGGVVPDGNPTGWSDTRTLSGITSTVITDVNVTLTLTGGFNGDLYAYLQHSSGIAILLNRPGRTNTTPITLFGFADSGMNVVFDDAASNGDSHVNLTGASIFSAQAWQSDGRAVNPSNVLDTDARTNLLDSFDGMDPNGSWTLFVADMSGGDAASSTVTGWGLQISAVPEPGQTMGVFVLLSSVLLFRTRRVGTAG